MPVPYPLYERQGLGPACGASEAGDETTAPDNLLDLYLVCGYGVAARQVHAPFSTRRGSFQFGLSPLLYFFRC